MYGHLCATGKLEPSSTAVQLDVVPSGHMLRQQKQVARAWGI
jgi:hypothetical protein